jgi:EpsI family protein
MGSGELSIGTEVEQYLKPDEYILRDYRDQRNGTNVNLFVAYFKSLQNQYGPHSPRICLPGAGWLVSSEKVTNLAVPGRPEGIPVNQFTMEKANEKILVVYWYQNDRNIWAQEFQAKLRLLPDLIRYRRSDVSLVRLVTPINSVTADEALGEYRDFTNQLFPLLAERFSSVSR